MHFWGCMYTLCLSAWFELSPMRFWWWCSWRKWCTWWLQSIHEVSVHLDDGATDTHVSGHLTFLTSYAYGWLSDGLGIMVMWWKCKLASYMMRGRQNWDFWTLFSKIFMCKSWWWDFDCDVVYEYDVQDMGNQCVCSKHDLVVGAIDTCVSGNLTFCEIWLWHVIPPCVPSAFVQYETKWNHIYAWDGNFSVFWLWKVINDDFLGKYFDGIFCFCIRWL